MLPLLRFFARPQQHVFVPVVALTLCLWLILSLLSTVSSWTRQVTALNEAGRWSVSSKLHKQQEPLSPDTPSDSTGEVVHPRLQLRPLPIHASSSEFPNVPIAVHPPSDDGSHITDEEVEEYLQSIWDLGDTRFWRTECDGQNDLPKRYEVLEYIASTHTTSQVKYFFALDLYKVRPLLPRLMGTLVQVFKQLGPEKCAVSVIEGRSDDGTYAILAALKEEVEAVGTRFYLSQSDIDPHAEGVDRIGALAELRNLAIEPLITDSTSTNKTGPPVYNNETILIFLNDIAVCPEDVYELLFQHVYQSAHQTCAMDWVFGGGVFYDSWVSRSMSGDTFFEVPQDVSFAFAENLFWDHALSKDKWDHKQPLQVYSCWGGMVTLSSEPFLSGQVAFRNSTDDECYFGEPTTLAKDFWMLGYGKIAVVPTVNVGYDCAETSRIKKRRGWVHDAVDVGKTESDWAGTDLIAWKLKPPGQIKCMPGWGAMSWTDP